MSLRKTSAKRPQDNDPNDFPERLRQIIGNQSVRAFARHCGISDSVLRQYLRGKSEPTRPVLLAIACFTGVAVEWLATGTGPMKVDRNPAAVQLADGDFTSLSHIMPLKDEIKTVPFTHRPPKNFLFRLEWLQKELAADSGKLAMAVAHGNAMSPTIDDGDTLLVNTSQKRITKDGVYLLQVNDTLVPRRIQLMSDGSIRVTCDNPTYASQTIPQENTSTLSLIGRVVWVGKTLS